MIMRHYSFASLFHFDFFSEVCVGCDGDTVQHGEQSQAGNGVPGAIQVVVQNNHVTLLFFFVVLFQFLFGSVCWL